MRPTRVTVIGGGCAALAAAWELTKPHLQGRYQVTVYQPGWRLGGKGASGRGRHRHHRIEEHGLHVWMGAYDNAFRMMRAVYEELGRDPQRHRMVTWRDAFFPAPHVGVVHQNPDGGWVPWSMLFPPLPGEPGDPLGRPSDPWTVSGLVARGFRVCASATRQLFSLTSEHERHSEVPPGLQSLLNEAETIVATASVEVAAWELDAALRVFSALLDAAGFEEEGRAALRAPIREALVRLLDLVIGGLKGLTAMRDPQGPAAVVGVALVCIRGAIAAAVDEHPDGFDSLDDLDFSDWLRDNGATREMTRSAPIRGLYSLGFSFERADPGGARSSAGSALRLLLRAFFAYRGAVFYKMRAGMGDVVFAPLYEVLKRRGVVFKFFHRLEELRLGPAHSASGKPHVAELDILVQAETQNHQPYQPLVDVRGLPCWPSEPDWSQLAEGERMREDGYRFEHASESRGMGTKTLRVGEDFDFVVLGVGLGAVPKTCASIIEGNPRWQKMLETTQTVATQALQLWMRPRLEDLGWHRGTVVATAFVDHMDTWADMSHLIPEESWPPEHRPGSIAYFCNVLPEAQLEALHPETAGFEARALEQVYRTSRGFVAEDLRYLWPGAYLPDGRFRWDSVLDDFATANVNPSDRYTLSLPGSLKHRISPLDDTYDNLTVCGDWTNSGLNYGYVEGAVVSGLLAAHALSRSPRLEDIVGYDGP